MRYKVQVLNLYAGIGGNRKLWSNAEVTAVEIEPKIASIYQDFFPDDKVVVDDAHQYLLEHFEEFDFIWSSPPCPTHSVMRRLGVSKNWDYVYPDMRLYQEVIFLKHWFKGKWCVENVVSYYTPLIQPQHIGNHYYWCNFIIPKITEEARGIIERSHLGHCRDYRETKVGFDVEKFDLPHLLRDKIINNCVIPEVGKHILDSAIKNLQPTLNEYDSLLNMPLSNKEESV